MTVLLCSPSRPATAVRRAAAIAALLATALLAACNNNAGSGEAAAPTAAGAASAPSAAPHASVAIARGRIEVPGGLLELSPAQDGVVESVAVHEGQHVTPGQVLLRLASASAQADEKVAQAELQLAEQRVQAQKQLIPALRRTKERLAEAAAASAAEPQRADDAAQALSAAESSLAVAQAEAEVSRQRLGQLRVQQRQLELRAPEAGTVVRVATQAGQRLQATAGTPPAITLLPQRALVVRAELNESYAAAVRPGMRATVTTDGDAAATTLPPARVVRMSPVMGTARLQDDAQRGPQRTVECVLAFDQPATQARPGQTVRVAFQP